MKLHLFRRHGRLSYHHSMLEFQPRDGNHGVLFYGRSEDEEILRKLGMNCILTSPASVIGESGYSALFAVSGNTTGNLVLCRKMRLLNREIPIIARCGDPDLIDSFEAVGVGRILTAGEHLSEVMSDYRRLKRD